MTNDHSSDVCKVCIPHTWYDVFDYRATIKPALGARVWVPFRNKMRLGIVMEYGTAAVDLKKIQPISDIIDNEPLLDQEMLALCRWVSRYYQTPLSEVLPLVFPKQLREGRPLALPTTTYYALSDEVNTLREQLGKRASHYASLFEALSKTPAQNAAMLEQAGVKKTSLKTLIKKNVLRTFEEVDLPWHRTIADEKPLDLLPAQAEALDAIKAELHHYHCFVLQGVTGSGKTEIYLQLITEVLAVNKQVLILVPEIGLTPQLLSRFRARFTEPIVTIHSALNETERRNAWILARENKVRIVIGTRAAVFTPLPQLGLIIIDEEHDHSLKQVDSVYYSARDTALVRAHRANIPILLGSATPSLESLYNCYQQKYTRLCLPQRALSQTPLHYRLIDLRNVSFQHGLCEQTLQHIQTHLQRGHQVLVFINRRGFAPVLLCHQCSWKAECTACDSHMTLHREKKLLICHHCGNQQRIPQHCPQCLQKELIPIGVGTQRVQEFLEQRFPGANVMRIDRDEVSKKQEFEQRLQAILNGETQLIVGTQMLAKGHHFPHLTLVVIIDADSGLLHPDFRATEHFGQLLTQVAGRAGRAEHAGEVIIQTHLPQHPLLNLLIQQGYDAFSQTLLNTRKEANLPPYYYLAIIRSQHRHLTQLTTDLALIKDFLSQFPLAILGPAPAPLARKANIHRMQLLIKAPSRRDLQYALTQLRLWSTINKKSIVSRWLIDVDPMDLS